MILILVAILGVSGLLLLAGLVRAKKDCSRVTGELQALRQNQEAFQARVASEARDSLEIQVRANDKRMNEQLSVFRTTELIEARRLILEQAQLEFDQWKAKHTQAEREDAIKKSRAVNRGLVAEQLAPHMAGFPYNPKDCHFIANPCDYLVFDGLDAGELKKIVLLEVKTGKAQMNARERQVRAAVEDARIQYDVFRLDTSDFT